MVRRSSLASFGGRVLAGVLCFVLAYSSSSVGINALLVAARSAVERLAGNRAGGYTDTPSRVFVGQNPGRDLASRGGKWDARRRAILAAYRAERELPQAQIEKAIAALCQTARPDASDQTGQLEIFAALNPAPKPIQSTTGSDSGGAEAAKVQLQAAAKATPKWEAAASIHSTETG